MTFFRSLAWGVYATAGILLAIAIIISAIAFLDTFFQSFGFNHRESVLLSLFIIASIAIGTVKWQSER